MTALGVDDLEFEVDAVLDLARDAAHQIDRPAAPADDVRRRLRRGPARRQAERPRGLHRHRHRADRRDRLMRAVICKTAGGPEVLEVAEIADPEPRRAKWSSQVAATAVNRADVMQREGHYPPPPGVSDVLGLECAGVIASVGDGVTEWRPGDRVCALLSGGGYAEQVAVPAGQVLPTPTGLDDVQAAALPEVVCTVWSNVFMIAALQPGEVFLVHGGGSGIGTMAIQLAKQVGATRGVHRRVAREGGVLPRPRGRPRGQLPRAGLRRGGTALGG